MEDNDYQILIDEAGNPYIEHAGLRDIGQRVANVGASAVKGVGRGVRQNAKYIQKVVDNGKTRYFYTQDEVKAYYNNLRGGARDVADKARSAGSNARTSMERSFNESQKRFNETRSNLRSMANRGAEQARSLSERAGDRARETYRNVKERSAEQANQLRDAANSELSRGREAYREIRDKSAARAEGARNAVNEGLSRTREGLQNITDEGKRRANNALSEGRERIQNVVNEGKRKTEKAASDLKEGKLLDRAFDKIEASEKKRLSKFKGADLYDRLQKLESKGQLSESEGKEYNRLVEEWKKSPHAEEMTKSINAQQRGYDTVKSVSDKISKVKQITESEANKLQQKYNEAKDLSQDEMSQLLNFLMKDRKR